MAAGDLSQRYRFERRVEVADGSGNFEGGWELQFTVAANRKYLRGGESVMASRLDAKSPVILRIRSSAQARTITNDWRAVDARTAEIFNIRERPQESDDRAFLEMLCHSGVAV